MPTIKPISDLRNYPSVLKDVRPGSPVYLTKNGRGRYAIVDIDDLERVEAEERLLEELDAGARSAEEGLHSLDEVRRDFGLG